MNLTILQATDVSFVTYIPTTILGLLGLVFGYLYFYFKNKDSNRLQEIQSVNPNDRIRAIEMLLNDLGITIDTSSLDSNQKFELIKEMLKAKTRKYLIIAITSIIFSIIVAFIVYSKVNDNKPVQGNKLVDTVFSISFSSGIQDFDKEIKSKLEKDGFVVREIDPSIKVVLESNPPAMPLSKNVTSDGADYYYDSTKVQIVVQGKIQKRTELNIFVSKTTPVRTQSQALIEFKKNFQKSLESNKDLIYGEIVSYVKK
jgi:hypothetical protein